MKPTAVEAARRGIAGFGVIVVGVMTALAGDAWLEARGGRARAEALIPLLQEDLTADSASAARIVQTRSLHDSIYAAIWATPAEAILPQDSVISLLVGVLTTYPFGANRTAFDALTDTDGLRYLEAGKLAPPLLRYYQRQESVVLWASRATQQYDVVMQLVGKYVTPRPANLEDGLAEWTGVPLGLTGTWTEIRQDEALMTALWYRAAMEGVFSDFATLLLGDSRDLLALVQSLASE